MSIHSTAIIHPGTKIGQDVQIDAYAVIGPDVVIGDRCRIWSHTTIEYTTLGNDCEVFPQASLGLAPQHLGYKGEKTKLLVGSHCVFREGVTVHRGTPIDKSITTIGDHGYFMALSHIAHDCRIGNRVIMANGAQLAGHVSVGDSCFISTTVGVHQHVRIGRGALVSGGAMVPLDVAPFTIAQGDRASLKGLNVIGMRRAGISRDSIRLVKEAYKTVFLSGLTLNEALTSLPLQNSDIAVAAFKEFLSTPKRGFVRPLKGSLTNDSEEPTE